MSGSNTISCEDFVKAIKSGAYLAQYLCETGRASVDGSTQKQIHCPDTTSHSNGDRNASARYYPAPDEHVYCHGCSRTFDLFNLLQLDLGCDFKGAVQWAANRWGFSVAGFNTGSTTPSAQMKQPPAKAQPAPAAQTNAPSQLETPELAARVKEYVDACCADYAQTDYLSKRGISPATAKRYNIGYDKAKRCVVIPMGKYGYSLRSTDSTSQQRYLNASGISLAPFNLPALWNEAQQPVFIVEGQIDALSVIEAGGQAVATGGTTHLKQLLSAIRAKPVDVPLVVAFDNDTKAEVQKKTADQQAKLAAELKRLDAFVFDAQLVPVQYKDANDFLLADPAGLKQSVCKAAAAALEAQKKANVTGRPLSDYPDPVPEENNPRALICNGWLRKGGGAFIVSVSGAGKSVLSIQLAMAWTLGKACFGIKPVRPLRIAIIQAEDDDDEVGWFKVNMRKGWKSQGWTDTEIKQAEDNLRFENFLGKAGDAFVEALKALQQKRRYDLYIINPLFSYFGADLSKNSDDTHFFREMLDPVIKNPDYGCGIIFIHHANKPPKETDRKGWGTDAFAQYIGAGGTDVAGWARAQLVLTPLGNAYGFFKLVGAKRAGALKWKDAEGNTTKERLLAYSKDIVFWREPSPDEIPAEVKTGSTGSAGISFAEAVAKMVNHLKAQPMAKTQFFNWCCNQFSGMKSAKETDAKRAYNEVTNFPAKYGLLAKKSGATTVFAPDPEAAQQQLGLAAGPSQPVTDEEPDEDEDTDLPPF